MKFKGTQGEWVATGQSGTPGHCFVAQVFGNAGPVANIESTEDPAIATANARLIAAAPDLLSACLGALRIQELWYPVASDDDEECAALNSMRKKFESAIAKALGES